MALIRQPARMASTGTAGTGVALPLIGVGIALPNPATSTYPRTPPRWAIRTACPGFAHSGTLAQFCGKRATTSSLDPWTLQRQTRSDSRISHSTASRLSTF